MITHALPVAVQRGTTTSISIEGQMDFRGVYKAIISGNGISAKVEEAKAAKSGPLRSARLQLHVAKDAELGVRELRLASGLGISSIGQILVVDDPVIVEAGDNNTPEKAHAIRLPAVWAGRIEAVEDVDCLRFHARAGQTITAEIHCARLQDKIHDLQKHADPLLSIWDSKGRELAANDDYFFADSLLTFTVREEGEYVLQVRDAKYDGDPRWVYALQITAAPRVAHVFPLAVAPGASRDVEVIGSAASLLPTARLKAPKSVGIHEVPLALNGQATNAVPMIVSDLPLAMEQEPNDNLAKATRISVPCGVNGRIGKARDLDHFAFTAKAGKAIRFEVKARRFGTSLCSLLDAQLDVLNAKGAPVASNDDANGKDPSLVFTPPADGDYYVRLRDLHSQGGPASIYFLEVDWAKPDFVLRADPDKAMIGPGSSTAWYVHLTRLHGFQGPVKVIVEGLPKGVSNSPLVIPPMMSQGVLVLTAAADAPRDAANVRIVGIANLPEETRRIATPNEEIYLPGGGRGRFDVTMQTVAVTEPSDILRVEVEPREIVLRPGGEARLDITLHRRGDYQKDVSLDVLLQHLGGVHGNPLPPGVSVVESKCKTLLGGGSTGHIVLRAAPNAAPIESVPICVLAHVSINFVVKVSYSSAPLRLSIRP